MRVTGDQDLTLLLQFLFEVSLDLVGIFSEKLFLAFICVLHLENKVISLVVSERTLRQRLCRTDGGAPGEFRRAPGEAAGIQQPDRGPDCGSGSGAAGAQPHHGFGAGGAIVYSRLMGEGNRDQAIRSFNSVLRVSIIISVPSLTVISQ